MANPPIGNTFWEGPLGVCRVEFNGVELGKTTEDTEINYIEDIKDIMYQQDGTQPADKIPTGQAYEVKVTLGEITTTRVAALLRGVELSAGALSAKLGRDIYRSGKDNFAKVLRLKRVDSDGESSTDQHFWITFYKAMPMITGNFQWGADTQRNLEVTFYCFYNSDSNAYGYSGYPTSLAVSAA